MNKHNYVYLKFPLRIGNKTLPKDTPVRVVSIEEYNKYYESLPVSKMQWHYNESSNQILVKFDHLEVFTVLSTNQIYIKVV